MMKLAPWRRGGESRWTAPSPAGCFDSLSPPLYASRGGLLEADSLRKHLIGRIPSSLAMPTNSAQR